MTKKLSQFTKVLWEDDAGATAIEYGLIAALIAVVIVATVTTIGNNLKNIFTNIASNLK